jgi:hypothetical protein
MNDERMATLAARIQGWYYVVTGLWPIFHIQSFELVTGPKTDDWLVKTVGVLVAVIGATLLLAAHRRHITRSTGFLGIASALGLAGIDLVYGTSGTIPPVYLVDAAAELLLAGLWAVARARR